jgi:uncharacterized membrane protein YgdD (TMEM256/DUF423 family)
MRPSWISLGALLGATFVLHSAFGAHWLAERADEQQLGWWRTGAFQHGIHSLALVCFGLFRRTRPGSDIAGWLLLSGLLVFSSTLYLMALGAPRWLGAVTPVGGVLLVSGWIAFALAARGGQE